MDEVVVKGAREHNLKNISLKIPKNQLVVFTGVSGSGKSSLAFDTIYAEGQRRYVESLSAYARQFLGVMSKPDVDSIDGLSPAISIDQKTTSHNPRSTVGTVTEIYDYLRLLFARIGHPHCPNCGREIAPLDKDQIINSVLQILEKAVAATPGKQAQRFLLFAPLVRDRKGEFSSLLDNLKSKGFNRARIDGQVFNLEKELLLIKTNRHSIEVEIERFSFDKKQLKDKVSLANLRSQLREAVEKALDLADGLVILSQVLDASFTFPPEPKKMQDHLFSEKLSCPDCNLSLPEVEPRSFSFNSPHGACPECKGLGNVLSVDPELVLNDHLSISEGGILPFSKQFENNTWYARLVLTVCQKENIPVNKPLGSLSEKQRQRLLHGTGPTEHEVVGENRFGKMTAIYETYDGILKNLESRYQESTSDYVRAEIEKYMRTEVCQLCQGTRLKKEVLSITIDKKSIIDVNDMPIKTAFKFIADLKESQSGSTAILNQREQTIARPILKEVLERLQFLVAVGLDYLTLGRAAATLAGGEAQRIRLASQIGSGLSGVLYVLDEPSIGLHPRDNYRLIKTLKALRDLKNSVLVVEHDREMIENADYVFDFGPGGGKHGGLVTAAGTPAEISRNPQSLTGAYLSGRRQIKKPAVHRTPEKDRENLQLKIKGVEQFNLKGVDVAFPLNRFICITGVSGSGKSTLIVETLYKALKLHFNPYFREKPGSFTALEGVSYLKGIHLIDQSPIGRTPRSNPATYIGAFSYIRSIFSGLKESRARGYTPGRFSFNVKGGRCENCQGQGEEKIEMQFLPPVWVKCEVCHGRRYNQSTLELVYKGRNIAEVLDMTIAEAREFFQNIPGLSQKLSVLENVGLDYIKLGQPAPTLSGGEAQRVKLADELAKRGSGDNLYLLDEPTTGLHFADLEKLLQVLHELVSLGNTVIVIEHNLEIIKNADYIIDLGPEGGDAGGKIVAVGTPAQIAANQNSYTGQFLKKIL